MHNNNINNDDDDGENDDKLKLFNDSSASMGGECRWLFWFNTLKSFSF